MEEIYRVVEAGKEYMIKIHSDGQITWFNEGRVHREIGPAIFLNDGTKIWSFNDKIHRICGPAIERVNGKNEFYQNGKVVKIIFI